MNESKFPQLQENFPDLMNEADAKKKGIKIREDWRNAEKGDFILTIDGVVLEILDRIEVNRYRDRKPTIQFNTIIGKFPNSISCVYAKRVPFNEDSDMLVGVSHLRQVFIEDLKCTGELGENGKFKPESIIKSYKSVFSDNNDVTALMRGRSILKSSKARKYMSKQLKQAFEDEGYDNEKIAKQYVQWIESDKIPATVREKCLAVAREAVNVKDKDDDEEVLKRLLSTEDIKALKPISQLMALFRSYQAQGKIVDGEFTDITEWNKESTQLLLKGKKEK
ncbi:hypothetical protein LCGC14_0364920 [marine sediment metagenome]|uniref:Uncharacterized protein n=1 Tax=marine sediment metagenome TaxID=412755 RepID=A0A0F9T701_9ZZZZ